MKYLHYILMISGLLLANTTICTAQKAQKPCSSEKYHQFDFWIGSWEVYSPKGVLLGLSSIKELPDACGIQENWTSKTSNYTGTSYNYYNSEDDTWNQVWLDNLGKPLVLKGSYNAPVMSMKSELSTSNDPKLFNQITWTKNPDGTVTQVWVTVDKNNRVSSELFRGIYKKMTR